MGAHTQGPWTWAGVTEVDSERGYYCIGTPEGKSVAMVSGGPKADAALISESPAMLDVLERVAGRWDKDDEADAPELGADLRAVIARAKGATT